MYGEFDPNPMMDYELRVSVLTEIVVEEWSKYN
jgi:hypothetical protein